MWDLGVQVMPHKEACVNIFYYNNIIINIVFYHKKIIKKWMQINL